MKKLLIAYLKFKFSWVSHILPDCPAWNALPHISWCLASFKSLPRGLFLSEPTLSATFQIATQTTSYHSQSPYLALYFSCHILTHQIIHLFVMFIVYIYLLSFKWKLHTGRDWEKRVGKRQFPNLPQYLEESLAHNECSVNVYWEINECPLDSTWMPQAAIPPWTCYIFVKLFFLSIHPN